ncbi:hypothetical protein K3495_g6875 [Podosphaera aphanis]|nr:hypothetical protein K3495_g6875 [Podosphaera aphanis]
MERVDACQRFSLDSEIFSSQCYSKAFTENLPLVKPLILSDNISESKHIRPIEEYCLNKTYAQYISSIGLAKSFDYSFRQLETIPGSPSTIISPDLLPNFPKSNDASRSSNYIRSGSLAKNSCEHISHHPRSRTSTISSNESHIHPLFRTDSLSHPEATPGTIVTAAPGAGLMIIDIACIPSLKNGKKDSLPGSGIDVPGKTK